MYSHYSAGNMEKFKEYVLQSNGVNQEQVVNIIEQQLLKYQLTQEDIFSFVEKNQDDLEIQQSYNALLSQVDANLEINDCDLTEEELNKLCSFAIGLFEKAANELNWGKGEEGMSMVLAEVSCQLYQHFQKTEQDFERAIIYFSKKDPEKFKWYPIKIQEILLRILT